MRRRRFLAAAGLGALQPLAACVAPGQGVDAGGSGADVRWTPSEGARSVSLPVPEEALRRGAPRDAIPAITDPVFGPDWAGVTVTLGIVPPPGPGVGEWDTIEIEPRLSPEDRVIGVERAGAARAYPLTLLRWHEVVNDDLGGPLLVTYCPLCASGVTAVREVDDQPAVFGVSGYLYRNALVLYDEPTDSLWSQLLAVAIRGPSVGESLTLVPSTLTTWGSWRAEHDDAEVLLPPPLSGTVLGPTATRDYTVDPYEAYDGSEQIGVGGRYRDDRLHPKALVLGVAHDGAARAYPLARVEAAGVVNDVVGGLPVVVAVGPGSTLVGYDRRLGGRVLRFERADARHLRADGSRWRLATGEAVDGPHRGTRLDPVSRTTPLFFFAWLDLHPSTDVYGATSPGA